MMESPTASSSEELTIIDKWIPEPLVPEVDYDENQHVLNPRIVTSKPGRYITIDGRQCLNFGTHNYLGLADEVRLGEASIKAARKYGVGSCGPRAFYGTMDIHLELEKSISDFLGVQEVALYSFGFSTIASAIPAYARSTDVVYYDERCNFAIQQGIVASRSKAIKFKHNNVRDLIEKIEEFNADQKRKNGKAKPVLSFIIVESIYAQTGSMCPLVRLMEVAKKYKIRLFMDESRSFGVLGKSGRGITEHLNVDIQDIDLILVSLENALCGFGGFAAGSTYVVDHQRLAGTGYCFSASLPPLQCQVALESINCICENPSIVQKAQENSLYANERFESLSILMNISHQLSPIKILIIRRDDVDYNTRLYDKQDEHRLDHICKEILAHESIAITVARSLVDDEMTSPIASIRVIVSGCMNRSDIDRVFDALEKYSRLY